MSLSGLAQVNVELSARCDRVTLCGFCHHQKPHSGLTYGDMDLTLLQSIRAQLEPGIVWQAHRDGDALAYPYLSEALDLFDGFIRSLVTHGETLAARADEVISRCESVCVSVFHGDPDAELQFKSVRDFLKQKGDRLPRLLIKIVGDMDATHYESLGVPIIRRRLHDALNTRYVKATPQMFEHAICADFLSKPAISWDGKVYQCVRFDNTDAGYLGNLHDETLDAIWNGARRRHWMASHIAGRRDLASTRCASCTYYGVPVAEAQSSSPRELIQVGA